MSVIRMDRRNPKRKPLSNLTNTPNSKLNVSNSKPKPNLKSDTASTGSNTIPTPINHKAQKPPIHRSRPRILPKPSTPYPKLSPSLPDSGSVNYEPVRMMKDKGKAVAVGVFSCPPIERARRLWDDIEDEESDDDRIKMSKTFSDGGKKTRYSMPMPALPRAFVEEQRKYFAEVDAFELEEEAVSESELE